MSRSLFSPFPAPRSAAAGLTATVRRGLGLAGCLLGLACRAAPIIPEPLPELALPGFAFPEREAVVTGWIMSATRGTDADAARRATEMIQWHGWGLWTALTAETSQVVDGQRLRIFETWLTPEDLLENSALRSVHALAQLPRRRAPLRHLAQLGESEDAPAVLPFAGDTVGPRPPATRVLGFVKYDPTAADHILRQQLLSAETLDTLLRAGAQQIPVFPATALVVKPLFQVLKARELSEGRYASLRVWTGPPAAPQPAPPAQWPAQVWIDVQSGGTGRGVAAAPADGAAPVRSEEVTYPISQFIHYRLSAVDAAVLNVDKPGTEAQAGDWAVLLAMHVSSREITRWTWQTYWWTPQADEPPAPSSRAIAARRPDQLRGAARHYAMAQAYSMLAPDQPHLGGENAGSAVYAYNPWIEAKFTPADLPDSLPGRDPAGALAANNHGIQTNCMSCHAQANYNPLRLASAPRFAGARYVDPSDPKFYGTLQVDFLWSIARHAR